MQRRSKQLLSWSMLFWALEQRRRGRRWSEIAARARCTTRTLERYSRLLTGRPLGAATKDHQLATRAFWTWVKTVWKAD